MVTARSKVFEQSWPGPGHETLVMLKLAMLVFVSTVMAVARMKSVLRSRISPVWLVAHLPPASRVRTDR